MKVHRHENPRDALPGENWRKPIDGAHIVRVGYAWPVGYVPVLWDIPVAGTTQPEHAISARRFVFGSRRWVDLVRDRENPLDENAVRVIGAWHGLLLGRTKQIGWIPSEAAAAMSPLWREGGHIAARVKTVFLPIAGFAPGVRLDIAIRRCAVLTSGSLEGGRAG